MYTDYTDSCPNISTTPLRQWGFQQCLHFSSTTLRGKHCRHPIAVKGVVDTFGLALLESSSLLGPIFWPPSATLHLRHLQKSMLAQ